MEQDNNIEQRRQALLALARSDPETIVELVLQLESLVSTLEHKVTELEKKVAELQDKLDSNSQNSSKPPSKDKQKDKSKRKKRLSGKKNGCLLYTSPSPRDKRQSRMPSSA